ncbi:hypothetical protein SLS58_002851 [Diplodia intermedia]|uniref:DUF6606 domain-containing protein n=1 Tax=Diplodia intermedia TaxID=856260 RepID=A0ABR3TY50_9PEZI
MDSTFQESLANFLEQCSSELIADFASHTSKAGEKIMEPRNTADPAMISQLLVTILETLGHRCRPPLLHKRVRDDVIWDTGSEIPWRRAPYWLVLRVGLARYLAIQFGPDAGRAHYKILLCVSLAQLLRRSTGVIKMELLHNLRAKLARRLVKLHTDRKTCACSAANIYDETLPHLELLFQSTLRGATRYIDATWDLAKRSFLRPTFDLPRRASRNSLRLRLPSSGALLESILANPFQSGPIRNIQGPPDVSCGTRETRETIGCYSHLANTEKEIADGTFATTLDGVDDSQACLMLSKAITAYLDQAESAYDGFPELQSIKILTVLEIWKLLDRRATTAMPLLMDYATGIPVAALDVLQLPAGHDMCRLQGIQDYLRSRETLAGPSARTIFAGPSAGCFAVRYYNESNQSKTMTRLSQAIKKQEERARVQKTKEWKTLSKDYEDISLQIARTSCMCGGPQRRKMDNIPKCEKCKMTKQRKKMKIRIHEDFLPKDKAQSKAVVFELLCPPMFSSYRAAAWSILSRLGYPDLVSPSEPTYDLQEYGNLAPFRKRPAAKITLASRVKSHLRRTRLPLKLDEVLRPHAMVFSYQDATTRSWCAQQTEPSFAHLCEWVIPLDSPLAQLQRMPGFSVDCDGPSSNEVLAAQTQCPSGLSVHEFTAVQSLFAGKRCRWPSILMELGSANLNFSNEAVVLIVSQLAVHAGPPEQSDSWRIVHSILRDQSFCARLLDQITQRLDVIAANWREAHMMDMLITLLLRLASLAAAPASMGAVELLQRSQDITHQWMGKLRSEMHRAADYEAAFTITKRKQFK